MIKAKPSSIFTITVLFIIIVMAVAALYFFNQMNNNYILIQQGISPSTYILDNHKFVQNRRALVFTSTLLFSGVSFLIMILLPSRQSVAQVKKVRATSQAAQPLQQVIQPVQQVLQPIQQASISAPVAPEAPPQAQEVPSSEVGDPAETIQKREETMSETPKKPEKIISSVDTIEDINELSDEYADSIVEGENDVVYGTGEITDSAIIDFVHKFPDSALKFLYRKNLDGTSITYEVEEIYTIWEERGLMRSKVKSYILTLTGWSVFPKKSLREVWVDLREVVFDA